MSAQSSQKELLQRHSQTIYALVYDLLASTGGRIPPEELFQVGVVGMLEAASRFDPALGDSLWVFAYPRVRGAMIDEIRRVMPVPAFVHRRFTLATSAVRATAVGTQAHEHAAERLSDAAERLGVVSPAAMAIVRGEAMGVEDGRMGAPLGDTDDEDDKEAPCDDGSHLVMRTDEPDAHEQLETAKRDAALHAAMGQLALEERMILRGLYFDGHGLIDEELGLSKSWASRIHTRALRRLKKMLAREWGPEPRSERPMWSRPSDSDVQPIAPEAVEADHDEEAEAVAA